MKPKSLIGLKSQQINSDFSGPRRCFKFCSCTARTRKQSTGGLRNILPVRVCGKFGLFRLRIQNSHALWHRTRRNTVTRCLDSIYFLSREEKQKEKPRGLLLIAAVHPPLPLSQNKRTARVLKAPSLLFWRLLRGTLVPQNSRMNLSTISQAAAAALI